MEKIVKVSIELNSHEGSELDIHKENMQSDSHKGQKVKILSKTEWSSSDNEALTKVVTIDEALEIAGGFGRLQYYALFAILIANLGLSMYYYHFPYLELFPRFIWKLNEDFDTCSLETVCENEGIKHWQVDWSHDMSIHNWITENNEYCISRFRIGLIGSSYFVGILLGSLLLQISDIIGRKRYIQIWSIISIVVLYSVYFESDLDTKTLFWSLLGLLYSIYLWSYTYLLEIVPKSSQNFMSYLFILGENIIPVCIGSSYFYFGGKHWTSPFSISLIFPILGFIMIYYLPKSPIFLNESDQSAQAHAAISKIARYNDKKLPENLKLIAEANPGVVHENISKQKYKMFTSISGLAKLGLIVMLFVHSNAQQVMWGFHVKHIKANIFLLNLIDWITSTIMIVSTYWLLKVLKLKTVFMIILIASSIWIIPMVWDLEHQVLTLISYLGIMACLKSLSTISFLAVSKIFKPVWIPIVLSISNMLTNIAMVLAPMLVELNQSAAILAFITTTWVTFVLVAIVKIE